MQGDPLIDLAESKQVQQIVERFEHDSRRTRIVRTVALRTGEVVESSQRRQAPTASADLHAEFDRLWLRSIKAERNGGGRGAVRLVDLFAGCGALSLGIGEACHALALDIEHVFAADINPSALKVYEANFAPKLLSSAPIESMVSKVGSRVTAAERALLSSMGHIDVLAGGPPCQGHSDLNNHTRHTDPRNSLFESMIRFAQLLQPHHVIIENVPGVQHDKSSVTARGREALEAMGYRVSEAVLTASEFGAAQKRRRYVLVATTGAFNFDSLSRVQDERTLRWACEDLVDQLPVEIIDSHAASSKKNRERIAYLFEHGLYDLPDAMRPPCHRLKKHSYNAVYGRLEWDKPAPTITSGFNSPGQGRFIHPERHRTLTPREAARIQSIPDSFEWGASNREALTQMIGNAVPPKLAYAVALEVLR